MKGKELAKYLLENPDWSVEFYFIQEPDEIDVFHERTFSIIDVADSLEHKTTVLLGEENGE